jgi:hypothetical protein
MSHRAVKRVYTMLVQEMIYTAHESLSFSPTSCEVGERMYIARTERGSLSVRTHMRDADRNFRTERREI